MSNLQSKADTTADAIHFKVEAPVPKLPTLDELEQFIQVLEKDIQSLKQMIEKSLPK